MKSGAEEAPQSILSWLLNDNVTYVLSWKTKKKVSFSQLHSCVLMTIENQNKKQTIWHQDGKRGQFGTEIISGQFCSKII